MKWGGGGGATPVYLLTFNSCLYICKAIMRVYIWHYMDFGFKKRSNVI